MNRRRRAYDVTFVTLVLAAMLDGGCAATGSVRREPFAPVTLTADTSAVRVATHGDLLDRLSGKNTAGEAGWLEVFLYGPSDRPNRYLRNPQGLAVRGGSLFVCDQGFPDVLKIDLETGGIRRWTALDDRPAAPMDVAVDENGGVFVADVTLGAVLVYGEDGRLVRKLLPTADPAVDFRPTSVLIGHGVLYVGDRAARRIHRYDLARDEWLPAWAPPESGAALGAPTGLAFTPEHMLLVADAISGVVHRIDQEGTWLTPIGRRGRRPGEFVRPVHVCCAESGLIVVTDAAKQSVSIFDVDGGFVTEVSTRRDGRPGLTLPAGVVSVPRNVLGPAFSSASNQETVKTNDRTDWFLVSDTLGADSLTLFSVTPASPGGPH